MYVVKRSTQNPILVPDRNHYWEATATFNMSVIKKGRTYYGIYRAISATDKLRKPEQLSTIGIAKSADGIHFEDRLPFITPEEPWEQYGCEDPRVTFFEGQYYIFYTALSVYPFSAPGIKVAVAISKDLKKVEHRHLVTPFNAKAMTLFPERIDGKITVILSVNTDQPPVKIAIAQLDHIEQLWDQKFWERWYANLDTHTIELKRGPGDHVEVGATPLKTSHGGWLLVYAHIQNYFQTSEHLDRIFGIEAVLLDLRNPREIVGRTLGPLLAPSEAYEILGTVSDAIFPSGAIIQKEVLSIYYGASDTTVCVANLNMCDLIATMCPITAPRHSFKRAKVNPIIEPNKLHPWEATATFNPAAIRIRNTTYIMYRTLANDNTSYIGLALSKNGITIDERLPEPIYVPREGFELKKVANGNSGCEDPRVTQIGQSLYMCYTAFDSIGPPRVAITSITIKNFLSRNWKWEKPVLITPEGFDDKDTCLFPEKIGGKYFILHRVASEICGDYLKSLDFDKEKINKCIRVIGPRINSWDSSKVGIATPPIKTRKGWLLLYHGVSKTHSSYRLGAVLLDLKDPALVIARMADSIFQPEAPYEKFGVVNNVVFPCGVTKSKGILYIYYGGADTVTGVATIELDILLTALTRDLGKE
jgi:predicted GH43/DUF377 family glycosyl hydrolase